MPTFEQAQKNSLSAILSYELSHLDLLTTVTKVRIASELTAAIQTLRMSQSHADSAFHQSQAAHYSFLKRDTLEQKNQSVNQVSFSVASIMYCIYKAHQVDGLQNELIVSTLNWVRDSIAKTQI
jgi:hypothetical protein